MIHLFVSLVDDEGGWNASIDDLLGVMVNQEYYIKGIISFEDSILSIQYGNEDWEDIFEATFGIAFGDGVEWFLREELHTHLLIMR